MGFPFCCTSFNPNKSTRREERPKNGEFRTERLRKFFLEKPLIKWTKKINKRRCRNQTMFNEIEFCLQGTHHVIKLFITRRFLKEHINKINTLSNDLLFGRQTWWSLYIANYYYYYCHTHGQSQVPSFVFGDIQRIRLPLRERRN